MADLRVGHTPGPWDYSPGGITIHGPNEEAVAETLPQGRRTLDNARLIAAAPDLLAACERLKRAVTVIHGLSPDGPEIDWVDEAGELDAVHLAIAAIDKATGAEVPA
jgi:hypothetical protein